ncbi:MAG: CopG family antitoxin [Acidimicrobiales bacterium]
MSKNRWETLLDRDWSDTWETLPEAPELVPRQKTAQITLRLPTTLLARIKRVAHARSLPYHALARSWLVDALRQSGVPEHVAAGSEAQTEQLNIKLDQTVLDGLKERGHELGQPYHRIAREWIEWEMVQAEVALGLDSTPASQPPIKELMVLLLHAANQQGDSAVRGMTRLQKLLFVIEQKLGSQSAFYAFNYGPFNEEVNDAARALEVAGFIQSAEPESAGPPSFQEMMATVTERATPDEGSKVVEFALSKKGHEAAERLRQSSPAYEQLFTFVEAIKKQWDAPNVTDLVARVYDAYPKYAERSLIREEVERRGRSRRRSH